MYLTPEKRSKPLRSHADAVAEIIQRKKTLSSLVPCDPVPLRGEIVGTPKLAHLKVTNTSKQPVTVAKYPSHGNQSYPAGVHGCGFGTNEDLQNQKGFITLKPGKGTQFEIKLKDGFLLADPQSRSLTVVYDNDGRESTLLHLKLEDSPALFSISIF